jgi:hypothetical protein
MMRWRVVLVLIAVAICMQESKSIAAPNAHFSLDGLTFVANALDEGEQIPISAIPVRIDSQSGSTWSISIEPADVQIPAVTLQNGERIKWSLVERAVGTATFTNGVADVTLSGRFKADSLDTTQEAIHVLTFTTRVASAEKSDLEVFREGVPMDRGSGYVQLVAAASDPPGSEHGIPFYVVLSGRFTNAPADFLVP